MKKLIGAIMVLLALGIAPVAAQTPDSTEKAVFLQALPDVPLMPGLYEMTDQNVVFDKPGGRIIEAVAVSETLGAAAIEAFYARALPSFGWAAQGENTYTGQQDTLKITIEDRKGSRLVHFSVAPRDQTP